LALIEELVKQKPDNWRTSRVMILGPISSGKLPSDEEARPMRQRPGDLIMATISTLLLFGFPGPAATQIFAGEAERSTETIFVLRGNNQLGKKWPSG
jgi:hypothetical protein